MKNRIAILLIIAITLIMTLSACGVTKDSVAVNDLGKSFMVALRDEDTLSSWNMLTTSIQNEIGGIEEWTEFAYPRNFSNWDFISTNVERNFAKMGGEATLGSNQYTVLLIFEKIENEWKISGINFTIKN